MVTPFKHECGCELRILEGGIVDQVWCAGHGAAIAGQQEEARRLAREKTLALEGLDTAIAQLRDMGIGSQTIVTALAYKAAREHGRWFGASGEHSILELGAAPGMIDAAGVPTLYGYTLELAGFLTWMRDHGSAAFVDALKARQQVPEGARRTWVDAPERAQ
jgi:hypothetical protein